MKTWVFRHCLNLSSVGALRTSSGRLFQAAGQRRRTRACRVPDECAGQTVCHKQLAAVKTADELKRRERKVRWCKTVPSQKVPCTPSNTAWTRSASVHVASGGCLWAVAWLWKKRLCHFWPSWVTGSRHCLEIVVRLAFCFNAFLCGVVVQRFNSVLLRESFAADSRPEYVL